MKDLIKDVIGLVDNLTLSKEEKVKLQKDFYDIYLNNLENARNADIERSKNGSWFAANAIHIIACSVILGSFVLPLFDYKVDSTLTIIVLTYYFGSAIDINNIGARRKK